MCRFFFSVLPSTGWLFPDVLLSVFLWIIWILELHCRRILSGFSLFSDPRAGVLCAYAANQNLSSQLKTMRRLINSNLRDLYTFANTTPAVRPWMLFCITQHGEMDGLRWDDKQMNVLDGQRNERRDGWLEEQMDKWMERWMVRQMNEWIDGMYEEVGGWLQKSMAI